MQHGRPGQWDDYRDPVVVRLRELGIATVYKLSTGQGGSVIMGTDAYGGFECDEPTVDAWLDELLTSDRGAKKSAKLGVLMRPSAILLSCLTPSASHGLRLLVGGSRADWDTVCVERQGWFRWPACAIVRAGRRMI